jgi:nucleoside-diphosphate-sugar epimerase
MRILVTGNMGYVGPSVVKRLRSAHPGAVLLGFDMGYFGSCLTTIGALPECLVDAQYFGDVRDFPGSVLEGVDGVVHLAAISNDPIGNRFEEVTMEVNHRASVELARQSKRAGVRSFVFASSCSMYGAAEGAPRTEKAQLNPLTAYARSKAYTERDLEPLASDAFKVTCLRFSTACGWSDRLRLDLVLNDFVAGAVSTGKISILSDGSPWRPLIDVRDMARAIDWALSGRLTLGDAFLAVNVGRQDGNYQVKDLAMAVSRAVPGVQVSTNKDAPPDKRSYRVDFSLYSRLAAGYLPAVDLNTTIKELTQGFRSIGFTDPDFRNSRLMRLHALMDLQQKGFLGDRLQWIRNAGPEAAASGD